MKSDHFITSTGRRIDLIPGWFEKKNLWPYGIKDFREFTIKVFDNPGDAYPKGFGFFLNKLVTFNYFQEIMAELMTGSQKWPRLLDIGTGPAIQPRLMKGAGICEEAWGIDILDRSGEFTDKDAFEHLLRLINTYQNGSLKDVAYVSSAIEHVNCTLGNYFPLRDHFSRLEGGQPFTLDRYIVGDFLTWEPDVKKFDIITAFMCIEYFDITSLLKKVYSLLNPRGVFFAIVDFWYELNGSSMHIPMDAPWLHARITRDDLLAYYHTFHPEISDCVGKCIYFANSHMTPVDYAKAGKECGMKLSSYRRSTINNKDNIHYLYNSNNGFFEYFYLKVLPEARDINPHVSESDFFTDYLTLVFMKE